MYLLNSCSSFSSSSISKSSPIVYIPSFTPSSLLNVNTPISTAKVLSICGVGDGVEVGFGVVFCGVFVGSGVGGGVSSGVSVSGTSVTLLSVGVGVSITGS